MEPTSSAAQKASATIGSRCHHGRPAPASRAALAACDVSESLDAPRDRNAKALERRALDRNALLSLTLAS
eukprot:7380912-Prymnesium_polylepis.1